jgi:hypothetical protein
VQATKKRKKRKNTEKMTTQPSHRPEFVFSYGEFTTQPSVHNGVVDRELLIVDRDLPFEELCSGSGSYGDGKKVIIAIESNRLQ